MQTVLTYVADMLTGSLLTLAALAASNVWPLPWLGGPSRRSTR